MILCDTNVIIEILKGDDKTIKIIERIGLENIAISSVTVMELYFGALNKRELNKIKKHLKALSYPLTFFLDYVKQFLFPCKILPLFPLHRRQWLSFLL